MPNIDSEVVLVLQPLVSCDRYINFPLVPVVPAERWKLSESPGQSERIWCIVESGREWPGASLSWVTQRARCLVAEILQVIREPHESRHAVGWSNHGKLFKSLYTWAVKIIQLNFPWGFQSLDNINHCALTLYMYLPKQWFNYVPNCVRSNLTLPTFPMAGRPGFW